VLLKGENYSLVGVINGDVAGAIAAVFLLFVLYITIRVIISFREERNEEIAKSKLIIRLTKRHMLLRKKAK